jgi:hypothetical protein
MLYSVSAIYIYANNNIFSALNQSEDQMKMQNQRGTLTSVSWKLNCTSPFLFAFQNQI